MRIEDMATSEPKRMSCGVGTSMIVAVCYVQARLGGVESTEYIRLAATALNGRLRQLRTCMAKRARAPRPPPRCLIIHSSRISRLRVSWKSHVSSCFTSGLDESIKLQSTSHGVRYISSARPTEQPSHSSTHDSIDSSTPPITPDSQSILDEHQSCIYISEGSRRGRRIRGDWAFELFCPWGETLRSRDLRYLSLLTSRHC
jgi:hypothetical protein